LKPQYCIKSKIFYCIYQHLHVLFHFPHTKVTVCCRDIQFRVEVCFMWILYPAVMWLIMRNGFYVLMYTSNSILRKLPRMWYTYTMTILLCVSHSQYGHVLNNFSSQMNFVGHEHILLCKF
jgi:hypothetical protein